MGFVNKPPLRQVASDDYVVTVDEVEYHPHAGEWVRYAPGWRVQEYAFNRKINEIGVKLQAVAGEKDENALAAAILEEHADLLMGALADRIIEWSWTDAAGRPLPQPKDDPKVLSRLERSELWYLQSVARGEPPDDRKNALSGTPTTSLATASPATTTQPRTTARSRGKD